MGTQSTWGSSEFSFTQDGHQRWRLNLLFSPLWHLLLSMEMLMLSPRLMARFMDTPQPQLMVQLKQYIVQSQHTMLLQLPTLLLLFTMLLQFTTQPPHTMSQNLPITNPQSAPSTTQKHGVLKMLNIQLMRLSMPSNIITRVSKPCTRMCSLILRTVLTV